MPRAGSCTKMHEDARLAAIILTAHPAAGCAGALQLCKGKPPSQSPGIAIPGLSQSLRSFAQNKANQSHLPPAFLLRQCGNVRKCSLVSRSPITERTHCGQPGGYHSIMPIYEYICGQCDARFEQLVRSMSSDADAK